MKKLHFLLLPLLFTTVVSAQPVKTLKKTLSFTMPRTADDDMPGTRGASVVWHPLQKKYYAAMAGNVGYPLAVFDATGKLLTDAELSTGQDVRGLWYNPVKKQIQGNTYSDYGWFYFTLDAKGIPTGSETFAEGMNQPGEQCVGAYSLSMQQVMFLKDGIVSFYNMQGEALEKSVTIHWGRKKEDGDGEEDGLATPEAYNNTALVFTGIKGAELGFLNVLDLQIELYNMADGYMTKSLKLPEDAPVNSSFNFAYTNGMYWLFNMELRTWNAYK